MGAHRGRPPVHPHARGEYGIKGIVALVAARFIPTLVGNTISSSCFLTSNSVHPHARGEYVWLSVVLALTVSFRFIPTLVGNTYPLSPALAHCAVHPHARGEYIAGSRSALAMAGSSPRSWGIPLSKVCQYSFSRFRFIPTLVGNTSSLNTSHEAPSGLRFIPTLVGNTYP